MVGGGWLVDVPLHGPQFEDLDRAGPVMVGQEREAIGERFCCSKILSLDDGVADEVAGCSFGAVIAY